MRRIFLERILNSIVGSIDNLLSGLSARVVEISLDLEKMDRQLDSVKDKIDQAITVYGTGLQTLRIVADDNPSDSIIVNDSEIQIPKADLASAIFAKYESAGSGQFSVYAIYNEGKSNNLTTRPVTISYNITRGGETTGWINLFTLDSVNKDSEPMQNKKTEEVAIDISAGDIIEFQYITGGSYHYNLIAATIKEFRINYSIFSITSNGGNFMPRQI